MTRSEFALEEALVASLRAIETVKKLFGKAGCQLKDESNLTLVLCDAFCIYAEFRH